MNMCAYNWKTTVFKWRDTIVFQHAINCLRFTRVLLVRIQGALLDRGLVSQGNNHAMQCLSNTEYFTSTEGCTEALKPSGKHIWAHPWSHWASCQSAKGPVPHAGPSEPGLMLFSSWLPLHLACRPRVTSEDRMQHGGHTSILENCGLGKGLVAGGVFIKVFYCLRPGWPQIWRELELKACAATPSPTNYFI